MSIRHSILAVLARGPATPASLREQLSSSATALEDLNMGQVTQTLGRLERDGLIEEAASQRAANGRTTTSWAIKPEGRTELSAWWSHPVERHHLERDELVLKVCLALQDADVDVFAVLDRQRAHVLRELRSLTAASRASHPERPEDELSPAFLAGDKTIYEHEAEIRWLDRVEDVLTRVHRRAASHSKES